MVTELATGTLQALIDGTWITAWRTGAVAAHSALLFGNAHPLHGEFTDVQRVGMVSLGNTAAACLHVLAEARPERLFEVTVLEYKDQHERFAERFGEFPNVRMRSVADMRELVGEKDVVVSAASHFDGDQCEPGWFAPGTTVIPIFKVGFNNLTPVFDLVFVDDVEGIKGWAGGQNIADPVEVASVVRGEHSGRTAAEQRIVCHNLGIALHDIYWASRLLDLTCCDGSDSADGNNLYTMSSTEVDLGAPASRVWV